MFQPRPYQRAAIEATIAGFQQWQKQLLIAPTGAGKTVMFCHIATAFKAGFQVAGGRVLPIGQDPTATTARTLILVHRDELARQALEKFAGFPLTASLEKAENKADRGADVVVASVQTMLRRKETWPTDHFALVVADEAHHSASDSWAEVLGRFDKTAKVLGVTATPDRSDQRTLGAYFENVAAEIDFIQLIKDGFLSKIIVRTVPLKIDLAGMHTKAGDYDASDCENALIPYLSEIADAVIEYAGNRKTLIFLPLVRTSKIMAEILRNKGFPTRHVDGQSEDRVEVKHWLKTPGPKAVCNAMLWTEGFDEPTVDCIVPLRPTKSRPLFAQMIGRGTRIAEAKENLLVLDFLWQHEKHKLVVRPPHLFAKNDETAAMMEERLEADSSDASEQDLLELFAEAEHEREEALRKALAAKANRKAKYINLVDYLAKIGGVELLQFEPTMRWHEKEVTDGQREALAKLGVNPELVSNRGHASKILDAIYARSRLNLASPKQVQYLERYGVEDAATWTKQKASDFLSEKWGKKPAPRSSAKPAEPQATPAQPPPAPTTRPEPMTPEKAKHVAAQIAKLRNDAWSENMTGEIRRKHAYDAEADQLTQELLAFGYNAKGEKS